MEKRVIDHNFIQLIMDKHMQKELKYLKRGNLINYYLNKKFKFYCEVEKSFDQLGHSLIGEFVLYQFAVITQNIKVALHK